MIETFRKSKIYLVGRHVWALAREAYYDEKEALKQKWAPKTAVLIQIRELNISYLLITQRGHFEHFECSYHPYFWIDLRKETPSV